MDDARNTLLRRQVRSLEHRLKSFMKAGEELSKTAAEMEKRLTIIKERKATNERG